MEAINVFERNDWERFVIYDLAYWDTEIQDAKRVVTTLCETWTAKWLQVAPIAEVKEFINNILDNPRVDSWEPKNGLT